MNNQQGIMGMQGMPGMSGMQGMMGMPMPGIQGMPQLPPMPSMPPAMPDMMGMQGIQGIQGMNLPQMANMDFPQSVSQTPMGFNASLSKPMMPPTLINAPNPGSDINTSVFLKSFSEGGRRGESQQEAPKDNRGPQIKHNIPLLTEGFEGGNQQKRAQSSQQIQNYAHTATNRPALPPMTEGNMEMPEHATLLPQHMLMNNQGQQGQAQDVPFPPNQMMGGARKTNNSNQNKKPFF